MGEGLLVEAESRAWSVYQSNVEWIARADVKASILLALQGVLLGVVVALTEEGRPLSAFHSWWQWATAILGVALLATGAIVSVMAVAPRLRSRGKASVDASDYLFFGNAQALDPASLEKALRQSPLPMLSRQLVISAQISSVKHRLVHLSAWLLLAGGLSVGISVVLSNLTQVCGRALGRVKRCTPSMICSFARRQITPS